MSDYEKIADANNLMRSGKRCMKEISWKYSTQNFYLDRINRVRIAKERLESMDRMSDGFTVFKINERGKIRNIRSVHINERMVQKTQSDFSLIPNIRPRLIYDNYASLEQRGISQAFDRLKVHLQRYYRTHGTNVGYIAMADLHAYFDSINHDCVYKQCKKVLGHDPKNLYLLMDFVDAFGDKSLGLGSQVSQILAIFYPNEIDHFIKEQLKIKGYGRYMDDFYMIHEDKEYLAECLQFVEGMYADLGIEMNVNKTKIYRIDKGFKFLKVKIHLTETGKIIMRPDHASIVRERRKLKKLKEKLDAGEIQYNEILQQYKSWRGYMEQFNSYKTLKNMDELFDDLFIRQWRCQENVERKQRNDHEYRVKFGEKQYPARRRHGLELESEWD